MRGYDPADPWSRPALPAAGRGWSQQPAPRIGVPLPAQREFFGNTEYARLFAACVERSAALGASIVDTDIAPLLDAARLLYEGPWVAERYLVARELLRTNPDALHPVTRRIIEGGDKASAADGFGRRATACRNWRRRHAPSGHPWMHYCCPPPAHCSPSKRSRPSHCCATASSAATPTSSIC